MDHIQVLKRAWRTLWQYRALWVFGMILAITASGTGSNATVSGGGGGGGGNGGGSGNGQGIQPGWIPLPGATMPQWLPWLLVAIGLLIVGAILVAAVATTIARNVARASLICMVDDHEETAQIRSVREGFRMGWSRAAWRIYLANLVLDLPLTLLFLMCFTLAALPLLLWITRSNVLGIVGTVAAIGLLVLVVILAIIVGVVVNTLKEFFWRRCALENVSAIDGIRQGVAFVRGHLRDTVVMWLLMVGIRIGWTILMIPVSLLLLVPFLLVGAVLGGLPGLVVGAISSLFLKGPWPWVVGAAIGIPVAILIIGAPFVFLSGIFETYKSTTWTLAYREMRALEYVARTPRAAAAEPPR
ncbi:MAG: hypothetical protein GX620_15245 [Chloroflexi bacterium]|nr:hypothetical protein [Chloroflexota bacterium]